MGAVLGKQSAENVAYTDHQSKHKSFDLNSALPPAPPRYKTRSATHDVVSTNSGDATTVEWHLSRLLTSLSSPRTSPWFELAGLAELGDCWRMHIKPAADGNGAVVYLQCKLNNEGAAVCVSLSTSTLPDNHSKTTLFSFSNTKPLCEILQLPTSNTITTTQTILLSINKAAIYIHSTPTSLPGWLLHDTQALVQVSTNPCIVIADNLLSLQECQSVIDLATPNLTPSRVSGGVKTQSRTSSSMFLVDELADCEVAVMLEEKMTGLMDVACRVLDRGVLEMGEATQVIRYEKGEFYSYHYDNSEEERSGRKPLHRAATVIIYLTDCSEGGETAFPYAQPATIQDCFIDTTGGSSEGPSSGTNGSNKEEDALVESILKEEGYSNSSSSFSPNKQHQQKQQQVHPAKQQTTTATTKGLKVQPKAGRALLFWSATKDGKGDEAALHAALKVIKGVKWVATRWCYVDNDQNRVLKLK